MDKISQVLCAETGIDEENFQIDDSHKNAMIINESQNLIKEKHEEIAKINLEEDYEFARRNMRMILEQAMNILPNAISLARETESPRSYESASAFIKTIAEINKDLLEISEKKLKSNEKSSSTKEVEPPKVMNNIIFTGSTEDILSKISRRIKENEEKIIASEAS